MKEVGGQLFAIWKGVKPLQKIVIVAITLCIVTIMGYLAFKGGGKENPVAIKEDPLVDVVSNGQKGFELFDTNTWIKGEKELQVLEMRALKGQLEKDLCAFQQIKSASVILDMAPSRTFGAAPHKTKASVILTLNPGARLATSQLQAITYHLAGAVHGLDPNMIAISDTTGKLYRVIDPEGKEEFLHNASLAFEEHIEQKVETFLTALVGPEHFFCSVQALFEKGGQKPISVTIAVVLDQERAGVAEVVERQLKAVVGGYEIPMQCTVDLATFEKKEVKAEEKKGGRGLILTLLVVAVALVALFPLFRRYGKKGEEDSLFRVMTRVDLGKLAEAIQEEDPKTIALMLSYLEPARAEQLIASFSEKLQEEILSHLSAMEYENY